MSPSKKVVLAYSGGLDTSYCIKHLSAERGFEVHALTVNTGGFDDDGVAALERRALDLGASSFHCVDAVRDFYDRCVKYLVFGNVLRNNTYPLSVSAERVFQALEAARYAGLIGAEAVAHGSTGAGNDQVRFDLVFRVLAPDLEIITPIREQQLTRQEEIAFLQGHGIDWNWEKGKYSINQGLWGTSVGGAETLTSHQALPESAFPTPQTRSEPQTATLQFTAGQLTGLNGETFEHPVEAIRALQALAGPYGIGRDVHVGDTIIGIKGRVGFEAAAPLITLKAHHLLEKHVLTNWQQYWKEQLANWYGMLLHEGQFLDPVMRNIETFLADTQPHVSGEVMVSLQPYRFELQGIRSEHDLMQSDFGQYGEVNKAWSGQDVIGFTRILANASTIHQQVAKKAGS